MNYRNHYIVCIALQVCIATSSLGSAQAPREDASPELIDAITLGLYGEYVAPIGKVESDSVRAAVELVATRGHGVPKFRELLRRDFATSRQKDNQGLDSRKLLAMITAVLERDGALRWSQELAKLDRSPVQRALPAGESPVSDSSLLTEVINFGYHCDRSEIADFAFAIRQSHAVQGMQFLLDVLHNSTNASGPFPGPSKNSGKWPDNVGGSWEDAKFHAAVGLAELGHADGVAWLIAHAKANDFGIDGNVNIHPHVFVRTGSLRANCIAALHDLSRLQLPRDAELYNWEQWWHENATTFAPRPVSLKEHAF